jgi:NADPH-dependent glutamate synthase beta subunit-like oxidoreductase
VRADARSYVIAIAEGRYFDGYKIARAPNPFASICGRVCGAPCEVECRRGSIDDAITIRALKRFSSPRVYSAVAISTSRKLNSAAYFTELIF